MTTPGAEMIRAIAACLLLPLAAAADEGMWTFDNFPADAVRAAYGAAPDQAWLDHVRGSSLRLAQGCSASLISASGLVMTNHHCARSCTSDLADAKHDYVRDGFYATEARDERRCPELEANRLTAIDDVTDEVHKATEGKDGRAFAEAEQAARATIAGSCGSDRAARCDVVKLYAGGKYALYRYERFQDLRLVWSPEDQAANFGGDPDNFEYPRYALDAALLRIYVDDKPYAAPDHLHLSPDPLKEGDVVFTSGNPGSTSRDDTTEQLAYERDVALPRLMTDLAERGGILREYASTSAEHLRTALDDIFFNANSLKALTGQHTALVNRAVMDAKVHDEAQLRERIGRDLNLRDAAAAWDAIGHATQQRRDATDRRLALVSYPRFQSGMLRIAVQLVRDATEAGKPDAERLPGYTDAETPALKAAALSPAPVYSELETLKLATLLVKMRQLLGPDDPDARAILRRDAPEALAADLVEHTRLADPKFREQLWQGGAEAVSASTDPMVAFVRDRFDAPSRAAQKEEEALRATVTRASAAIARARFALNGTKIAPDATFSPRISFGAVSGYDQAGGHVPPVTNWAGAFGRETGAYPFTLPESWTRAMETLVPFGELDVATTNDIVGGNSGSPLIGLDGQAVGLIFDGNRQSLAGAYAYPGAVGGRAVAVTSVGLREALATIYHADRIVREIE